MHTAPLMPILSIVGYTGMNSTFQLALVFLCSETEDEYIWALTGLREMSEEGLSQLSWLRIEKRS